MPLLKRLVLPEVSPPEVRTNGHVNAVNGKAPIWGTSHDGKRQQRALLASATNISNGSTVNRIEAQRLSKLKQAWQEDAWAYRDSIGELRYATTYLGNAARKIRLYPAAYVEGQLEPQPLALIKDCPEAVKNAADDALKRLAANPLAMTGMLRDIAENFEVAGECFLLGWPPKTKDDNDEEIWEIRSTSEIAVDNNGELTLKEPGSNSGDGKIPEAVFASRLWYPHPRRKALADSPFAAILDICEEMLILSRDIRASGRSRLANNGLLLLPDTLTVVKANVGEDANDDQQDPFMQELIAAAVTAIQDEGSASAIVPIIVRGPRDDLSAARQLIISRPDSANAQKRTELIERMATALDLPAEVLTGKANLNHWTAWSISDDTFSDHIEPLVMVIDDALTAGYLRLALKAADVDPVWVNKVIIWHDATRLVRHPDRSQDAIQAYDRFAVSQKALRGTMGFADTDAPTEVEILERLMARQGKLEPAIVAQILKRLDPSLDVEPPPVPDAGPAIPASEDGGPSGSLPSLPILPEGPPQNGKPKQEAPTQGPPETTVGEAKTFQARTPKALVAANSRVRNGSKRLGKIDTELTQKLNVATNAAMSRALERAGARIRTQVGRTAAGRAWCATHSNLELPFLISKSMIASAGLSEDELLRDAWQKLSSEWSQYLATSDQDALKTVARMIDVDPDELGDLAQKLGNYADNSWDWLEDKLTRTARGYLSDSMSLTGEADEITTTQLVPYSTVRESVARAGGAPDDYSAGIWIGEDPTSASQPLSGIGTGPAVSRKLRDNGMQIASYTWVHGTTANPFPPHEELDGVEFASWRDDVLHADDDFIDHEFYMPGDHPGCTCDFDITWEHVESDGDEDEAESEVASAATHVGRHQFYEGQNRDEGGKFGEGKLNGDEGTAASMPRADATKYAASEAGMARGTAGKLYDQGRLDSSIALAQVKQPTESTLQARDIATQKHDEYKATITPEDKARAEARHAQSSRQGGDDRPGYPTRVRLTEKLVEEFGDGKTCPCIYCGRTLEPATVSLERLVPGSEGGKYVMANLAPTDYDCNNWRGNTEFEQSMKDSENDFSAAHGLSAAAPASDQPVVPLGTMVRARCVGYSDDPTESDPNMPADIPLEYVSGELDGFYVKAFGYFKYIVAGYDVEVDSIKVLDRAELEDEDAEKPVEDINVDNS